MDLLFSLYTNVHTASIQDISSLLSHMKKPDPPSPNRLYKCTIATSTITPAQTTTQLLLSDTQSIILPQRIIDLAMILQINSKIPVSSSGFVGHIQPCLNKDPLAAHQPKRPTWTESHAYIRGSRTNADQLRILSMEINMIHACKITRSLKPRRSYLSRRQDSFVWGKPSPLRKQVLINKLPVQH